MRFGTLVSPKAPFHAVANAIVNISLAPHQGSGDDEWAIRSLYGNREKKINGGVHRDRYMGKIVKGIGRHTGSLPCLALGCRCGSHACRIGRLVGSTRIAKSVAHKVGDDVNVYAIPTVSQTITIKWTGVSQAQTTHSKWMKTYSAQNHG